MAFVICPVQTKIWWACIQSQLMHRTTSSVFGGKDGAVERKYGEYPTGKRAPSSTTIDEVEAKLPGSRRIIYSLIWPILHGETVPTHCLRARSDVAAALVSAPLTFEGLELHLVAAKLAMVDQSVDRLTSCVDQLRDDAANLRYVPELGGDFEGFATLWREFTEVIARDRDEMRDARLRQLSVQRRTLSCSGSYARVANRREPHLLISLSSMSAIVFAVNASQVAIAAIVLALSALCAFSPHAREWYAVDGFL